MIVLATARMPSSRELFFHAMDVSDIAELRRSGTHFSLAECRGARAPCMPQYIRAWQAAIAAGLPSSWLAHSGGSAASSAPSAATTVPSSASWHATGPHWRSCAVVGSSASLLRTVRGRLIDAADAVFRVNHAPTRGYERHSGRRTTVRVFGGRTSNGTVAFGVHPDLAELPEESAVLPVLSCPPVKWVDRCWTELQFAADARDANGTTPRVGATTPPLTPAQRRAVRAPRLSPHHKLQLLTEVRHATGHLIHRPPSRGTHPTTGAVAVHVALHMCKRVLLFGFGNASCLGRVPRWGRYYDRTVGVKNYLRELARWHDYEVQQRWLQTLVQSRRVVDAEGCILGGSARASQRTLQSTSLP